MNTLFIVSTPIGNLDDISKRALETLRRVSLILCEDTRVTKKLLIRYQITTPVKSYHQHSGSRKVKEVIESLSLGDVALVTDAGTPGIADPGNELINELINRKTDKLKNLHIVPIPGPSALTAAASICGFNMSSFTFLGYVPKKKGRKKFFQEVADNQVPMILYETPHRIEKTLEELRETLKNQCHPEPDEGLTRNRRIRLRQAQTDNRKIVVCRELTKKFESIYRGTITEVIELMKHEPTKGEYILVVDKK